MWGLSGDGVGFLYIPILKWKYVITHKFCLDDANAFIFGPQDNCVRRAIFFRFLGLANLIVSRDVTWHYINIKVLMSANLLRVGLLFFIFRCSFLLSFQRGVNHLFTTNGSRDIAISIFCWHQQKYADKSENNDITIVQMLLN